MDHGGFMEGINKEYLVRHRARFRSQQGHDLQVGKRVAIGRGAFMELEEDDGGFVTIEISKPELKEIQIEVME